MSSRGAFIVIEGLDRSGKTTQTSLLNDHLALNGHSVKLVKFPDRTTPIGKMIDNYLRSQSELDDRAIHLLFSANRWEAMPMIEKLLREGTTVICDRYAFSGIAFTFAKTLMPTSDPTPTERLTYEWCRAPDTGLPAPDLTIFLDITPDAAKLRGGYGNERYEKEEMQRNVRQVFRRIEDNVCRTGGRWVVIDAGREKEVVQRDIQEHVQNLSKNIDINIGTLWSSL